MTGILLPRLVHSVDVQGRWCLSTALQHSGSWWEERTGQIDPSQKQCGLWGIQSQPQISVCPPLQPPQWKLPFQWVVFYFLQNNNHQQEFELFDTPSILNDQHQTDERIIILSSQSWFILFFNWQSFQKCIQCFSNIYSAFTFSSVAGSYDKKIIMWDIGGVDSQYNYKVVWVFLLETFTCIPSWN